MGIWRQQVLWSLAMGRRLFFGALVCWIYRWCRWCSGNLMVDLRMPRTEYGDWEKDEIQNYLSNRGVSLQLRLRSNDFGCCQRFVDPRSSYGWQWQFLRCDCGCWQRNRSLAIHWSSIDFVRSVFFHDFIFGQNRFPYFGCDFHDICRLGCLTPDPNQFPHSDFYQWFRICRRFIRWRQWDAIVHDYFPPSWSRCVCEWFSGACIVWLLKWRLIISKVIRCYKCRGLICMRMMS